MFLFTFSTGDRKDIDTFKRRNFFATKIKRISGSCIDIHWLFFLLKDVYIFDD